jgi:hypothetical protein
VIFPLAARVVLPANSVDLQLNEMYLVAYLEAEVALLPSKFALTRGHLDRLLAPG